MLDSKNQKMCSMQGDLFVQSAVQCTCSSAVFIRRFMNSSTAARIDQGGYFFESSTHDSLIAEVNDQYGESDYGHVLYSQEQLYWIGYIYRYWNRLYNVPSKYIVKVAPPREMRKAYGPYHTLSPEQTIERLMEAKGIPIETDDERRKRIMMKIWGSTFSV